MRLLYAGKGHLSARDVLLRVLKVVEERVFAPKNTLVLVGVGIREASNSTGLATKETVKVGTNLVSAAGLDSVALSAPLLEKLGSVGGAKSSLDLTNLDVVSRFVAPYRLCTTLN